MGIPEGDLYSDSILEVGRQQEIRPSDIIKTFNAEADGIKFGRALGRGSANLDAELLSGAAADFIGVALYSVDASEIENDLYKENDPVAVIQNGIVNVWAEEAISFGDPVRVRHTVDTGKYLGDFATTADAGKTALLSNAKFLSETTEAGIVVIELGPTFALTADV
jgi:hypothetical protein